MSQEQNDTGVYYFLGNITSHILHALPLHEELGGTFIVLSRKAKRQALKYNVPVINVDDKPRQWMRFSKLIAKPISHYLRIGKDLKKTTDFLNQNARVVIFYEPFDFAPEVRLTKPKTIFLTHGFMLKEYMRKSNRLATMKQYDYMAAVGPRLKSQLIERDGISSSKLVDLGLARTDKIVSLEKQPKLSAAQMRRLTIDPRKPIFAYLPTFWGSSSIYTTGKDIMRKFPDKYTLIFRPHPQTPKKILNSYLSIIKNRPNIIYAPEGKYPKLDLLGIFAASTAIIGDLSSVMVEAILLDKPLLFVQGTTDNEPTDDQYKAIRGIIAESQIITPGKIDNLGNILDSSLDKGIDSVVWRQAKDELLFHHDGTSTATIAAFVRSLLQTNS